MSPLDSDPAPRPDYLPTPLTIGEERALRAACNQAGWPRPYSDYAEYPEQGPGATYRERLPAPWILGEMAVDNEWADFDYERYVRSYRERLCGVCGLRMGQDILLGVGQLEGGHSALRERRTSAAGNCPRCMLVAIRFCPHLQRMVKADPQAVVAWHYRGDGNGLHKWSPIDPMVSHEAQPVTLSQIRDLARQERQRGV